MERIKSIWTGFFCLLGSYYLTWCVDKITLKTLPQKIFVFAYFLIILGLLSVFWHRYLKSYEITVQNKTVKVILSTVIAAILFVSGFDVFIGKYQPTHISITAMGQTGQTHSEQKGTEVWITSLALDGEKYELSKIPLVQGWESRDNSLLSYQNQPSTIEFELPGAENIEIDFLSHSWSGEVLLESAKEDQKIDLYQPEDQGEIVKIVLAGEERQLTWWNILVLISCFVFLTGLVNAFIYLIKKKLVQKLALFSFMAFFLAILPFEMDGITFIALIGLNTIISMYLPETFSDDRMKKYLNPKVLCLLILIAIYGAFALVGQSLFLAGEMMTFSVINFCKYLISIAVVFIINYLTLFLLETANLYSRLKLKDDINRKNGIKLFYFYFIIFSSIWMIALISFFPANMTPDSVIQWEQAQGIVRINNHHPAFHTLVIRWISYIYPSPFLVASFQVFFCAFVLSIFWVYFVQKSRNRHILTALAIMVAVSPGNIMLVTTLWKDIPYTFSLLWLGIILLRLFENTNIFFKKPQMVLSLIVSLIFVYEFRHNGVIPFAFVLIVLLILAVTQVSKNVVLTGKIITCGILSIVCIAFINGPVFKYYNVNTKAVEGTKYTVMLTALGSVAHNNLPLETETKQLMESTTVTLDEYKQYYSRFNGDSYIFGIPNKTWVRKNLKTDEVMKAYFKEFAKYPSVIIKDRLDGSEILWNITQAKDSFNYKYQQGVWKQNEPLVGNRNSIAKFLRFYSTIFERVLFLNVLFWRSGIYIVFLMILLLFCYTKKIYKSTVFIIPCVGNIMSLILSLYHQSYRYIYFIPLSVILFALIVLTYPNKREKESIPK